MTLSKVVGDLQLGDKKGHFGSPGMYQFMEYKNIIFWMKYQDPFLSLKDNMQLAGNNPNFQ